MRVNDSDDNPIEIAAGVVGQVVDNFVAFVGIQIETAVRYIATSYPYDARTEGQLSLRDNATIIAEQLSAEAQGSGVSGRRPFLHRGLVAARADSLARSHGALHSPVALRAT